MTTAECIRVLFVKLAFLSASLFEDEEEETNGSLTSAAALRLKPLRILQEK